MVRFLIFLLFLDGVALAQELKSKRIKEIENLNQIVISADPFNPSLLENAAPVTVIDKEKLRLNSEPSLGETLSQEPGVSSSFFGAGASRPIVRGNSGERVKVLKNGVGTLDLSSFSEDHQVAVNPLTADSIEILRGPETLLFGSQAIGGVVNVIDNIIPEKNINKLATGTLNFRAGSADSDFSTSALIEGQAEQYNWHVDVFSQDSDDYKIPGAAKSKYLKGMQGESITAIKSARLDNSFSRSQGINIGNSLIKDWGYLGFSISTTNSTYGVPGDSDHYNLVNEILDSTQEENPGVSIDLKQVRLDLKGKIAEPFIGFKRLKFNIGASDYNHQELEGKVLGTSYSNNAAEGRFELAHNSFLNFEGIIGSQFELSDFLAVGNEAFIPSTNRSSVSTFLFEEKEVNKFIRLQSGVRYEHVNLSPVGERDRNFNPFGFSMGVLIDPNSKDDYVIGLTSSYTQRAPSSPELFADGLHTARQIFEMGDTSLKTEKSKGLDLSIKKNTGLITGAINLFIQDYADYINLSSTSRLDDGFAIYQYEQTKARLYGGEFEFAVHLHELLDLWVNDIDLFGQLDLVRGKNKEEHENLPRIPPVRSKIGINYGWRDVFKASCDFQYVSAQSRVATYELPTSSYSLLNASISQKLPSFFNLNISFFIRGTNLTNQEARVHTSFIKDFAPLRARSIIFGVEDNF